MTTDSKTPATAVQFVTIDADNVQQRIDNFLIAKLKGVPKSMLYRILRKGEVRVNKKRVKPDYKLCEGDYVRIPPVRISEKPAVQVDSKRVAALEHTIIFEDDRIMLLNKPSGLAVHGGSGLSYGLIEALRILRPEQSFLELVHRLDRDTSGCLLVAKKRSALRNLHEQLREKTMLKRYHALVMGQWPSHRHKVVAPLQKNVLKSGERLVSVSNAGKPSETTFKVLARYGFSSLVEASPITGRTHQIRVHCLHAGCPIGLDDKYGNTDFDEHLKSLGLKRLFLHAHSLEFTHPHSGKKMQFTADYDAALSTLLSDHADEI